MQRPVKLLRYSEWGDNETGWLCNDVSDLCSVRAKWWVPARMLNISPAEYVQLLIERFHPDRIKYFEDTDVLVYSWKRIDDMRKFKNWLNAEARKRNFIL
jgi:hypothetical protein